MRRTPLMLTAAAAALVPLVIAATAIPAQAASYSLTLTTLGRDGAKVTTTGSAVNVSSGLSYQLPSGKKVSLPKGTYAVLVDVWNAADDTDTMGGKVVSVTGANTTTIDARQGQELKVSLDAAPGSDYQQRYDARVCMGDTDFGEVEAYNYAGHFFVIPNSSKTLRFSYLTRWTSPEPSADSYVVSGMTTGIPGALGKVFKRSSLATIDLQARSDVEGGDSVDFSLQPQEANTNVGCQSNLYTEVYSDVAPFQVTAHVSAGKWDFRSDEFAADDQGQTEDIGGENSVKTLSAGQTYAPIFYQSSWGPAHVLPIVLNQNLVFESYSMFGDPVVPSQEGSETATASLSLNGTVLSTQQLSSWGGGNDAFTKKLTSAGWYTLNVDASRYHPGITYSPDLLSTRSTVSFYFYADPSASQVVPGFLTRFTPGSLTMKNQAQPSSITKVGLALDRSAQDPDATYHADTAKTVQAWASFDGGITWKSVPVLHSGSSWAAMVPNPKAGAVSLRSTVTDTKGNRTTTTVYRAYGIAPGRG